MTYEQTIAGLLDGTVTLESTWLVMSCAWPTMLEVHQEVRYTDPM